MLRRAFNYFESAQNLDAYDVIETIAKQPVGAHNKVGMLGISYGGISPALRGTAGSPTPWQRSRRCPVLDGTSTTLYPGRHPQHRFRRAVGGRAQHDAEPAGPSSGEHWAYEQTQKRRSDLCGQPAAARRGDNLPATIKKTRSTTLPWLTRWTR